MHIFARGGFHGGGGGGGFHYSDFVSHDAAGHVHYHLLSILTAFGWLVIVAGIYIVRAVWPDRFTDVASQPLTGRFYMGVMLVLVAIVLACFILSYFPQFSWS
jgi:hypothetical protein